jgi:hypothetical protein
LVPPCRDEGEDAVLANLTNLNLSPNLLDMSYVAALLILGFSMTTLKAELSTWYVRNNKSENELRCAAPEIVTVLE